MYKFIENIEIKDYKCFDDFQASGFKRVNLIGGLNNVGKTAFMEACYINIQTNTSLAMADLINRRHQIDLYGKLLEEVGIQYILNFAKNEIKKYSNSQINSNISKKNIEYREGDFSNIEDNEKIIFIDSIKASSSDLEIYYANILENRLENKIDELLNKFDSSLESFRIISSKPKCSLKSDGKFYELNEFGDGLHKYITFLCLLYGLKDTTLFIDEIELGIHYTQFDKIWELILNISKERNIQLFITTHSKECIESYIYNAKKSDDNDDDIVYFEMGKNIQTNKIFMRKLDIEQLEYELTHKGRYRGE